MESSFPADISQRTRRHIAWRLLPFIFLLYLIQYIDRFNVSFAALRMKAELGLSDTVYGFGASVFILAYVFFEIPGVILVERWSARKWIMRIMVSWGVVTIFTAFIHTAAQFYLVRFLLGAAEASFFPGVIVFLTHWFTQKDRARAVAAFYAAVPVGAFLGSAVAGWLLGVNWMGLSGWRWLFIVEGIPAIVCGAITWFYLTDWPSQARWLSESERSSVITALDAERAAKTSRGPLTFWDACKDSRLALLVLGYFFFLMASITNGFWMPIFLQRLSHLQPTSVARLVMIPSVAGLLGLLLNSWSSDRSGQYKWHTVVPVFGAGCCYFLIGPAAGHLPLVIFLFSLHYFFSQSAYPSIWAIPSTFLSGTTAAVAFGLLSAVGGLGAFFGPYVVGYLNDNNPTHSIHRSLFFISFSFLTSAAIFSFLRFAAVTLPENRKSVSSPAADVAS